MKVTQEHVESRRAIRLKLRAYYKSVSDAMIQELSKEGITTSASVVSKFFAGKYSKDYDTWLRAIKTLIERGEKNLERAEKKLQDLATVQP